MLLGYPHLFERAEGRQDGSFIPYWALSIAIKQLVQFLEEICRGFRSPTSLARRTDKDCVNNCTAAVRSAVTNGSVPQHDLAAVATAAVAAFVWHGHQLTPMTFSSELDCSGLLALIHQPKAP